VSRSIPEIFIDRESVVKTLDQRQSQASSTVRERVAWLLAHSHLWETIEAGHEVRQMAQLTQVAVKAKAAGLYADVTYPLDIRHGLIGLIRLARACRRFGIDA
jgi:hypothetical protein